MELEAAFMVFVETFAMKAWSYKSKSPRWKRLYLKPGQKAIERFIRMVPMKLTDGYESSFNRQLKRIDEAIKHIPAGYPGHKDEEKKI